MKTILALAVAFACTAAFARERPAPPEKKPARIKNMGAMKNCPHETMTERRGPVPEGPGNSH